MYYLYTINEVKFWTFLVATIFFSDNVTLDKGNKRKNKQMRLHQTKKVLHGKGNR